MFLILTRFLLWAAIFIGFSYLVTLFFPKKYLIYIGYTIATIFLLLVFFPPPDSLTFDLAQILSLPFKPLGLFIIILLNILRGDLGSPAVKKRLVTFSIFLLVTSLPYVPRIVSQTIFERDAFKYQEQGVRFPPGTPEAIVLLGWQGNDSYPTQRSDTSLAEGSDLVLHTRDLYFGGAAPRIIVSAGPRYDYTVSDIAPNEGQAINRALIDLGVSTGDIIVDKKGRGIHSSARNVAALMDRFGIEKDIILVSTALSAERALETFQEFDMTVTPSPAAYRTVQPVTGVDFLLPQVHELIPSVEGLEFSTVVIDEFFHSVYYLLRGWISPGELITNRLYRAELPTKAPVAAAPQAPFGGVGARAPSL